MKVKIISTPAPHVWYAKHIGEIIEVDSLGFTREGNDFYFKLENHAFEIPVQHCEVIPEPEIIPDIKNFISEVKDYEQLLVLGVITIQEWDAKVDEIRQQCGFTKLPGFNEEEKANLLKKFIDKYNGKS